MSKWLITRTEYKYSVVEAETSEQAVRIAQMGLVPEDQWHEDDRPYEYSDDMGEPYEL